MALKHDELKEMGITSVGHRLTILKSVYETKVKQDVPIDPDHYIPLCMCLPPPAVNHANVRDVQLRIKASTRLPPMRTLLALCNQYALEMND